MICTGQDAGLSASLTGIQMREENPGGHSGESASSGGQRPGKQEHQGWSMEQGLQTLDLSFPVSRRAATRLEKSGVGLRVELLLCYF